MAGWKYEIAAIAITLGPVHCHAECVIDWLGNCAIAIVIDILDVIYILRACFVEFYESGPYRQSGCIG